MRRPEPRLHSSVAAAVALCAAACASTPHLTRASGEWRVDGATYFVDPAPSGAPMPDGWVLRNYESEGDAFRKKNKNDHVDLFYMRDADDGLLIVTSKKVAELDQKKHLRVLLDRDLSALRLTAVNARAPAARSLEFRTVTTPASIAIDGAEALAVEVDSGVTGVAEPIRQIWMVSVRSLSHRTALSVIYSNTPSQFRNGIDDVKSFLNRLHVEDGAP